MGCSKLLLLNVLLMQNMEEHEEDASGIQVSSQSSSLKYGLWINTTKNPRLKTVDFPHLGISLEVVFSFLQFRDPDSCLG